MQVEIAGKPSFAHLRVHMDPGDSITAESDAMASMAPGIRMAATIIGGFLIGLIRKLLGGESLFANIFSAPEGGAGGELVLTQAFPGDIVQVDLKDTALYLQPGAFIACGPGVKLGLGWAGFASFIAREGLFRLKVSGSGSVWLGAYGGIFSREVEGELVVDTSHLVAYEPTVGIRMGLAGGIFSSFFSGEGLVSRVSGRGQVYLQSRSVNGLSSWTNTFLY
jgi:uncharacterized protein (TIGR00266 family)